MSEATNAAVINPDAPDSPIPGGAVGSAGTLKTDAPAPSPSLAAIKAMRRAAPPVTTPVTPPVTTSTTAPETPKASDAPPSGTPEAIAAKAKIDVDEATLNKFVTENRELREARQRVKDLETKAAAATKLEEAQKLAQEGKHYDAIKALGLDFDAAAREVMQIQADPATSELAALRKEVEELKGGKAQEAKAAEEARKQALAAQREAGVKKVQEFVSKDEKTYPVLSKSPDLVAMSLKGADEAYDILTTRLKRDLTDTEKNDLIRAALAEGEDKWGKVFQPKPLAAQQSSSGSGSPVDSSIRGGVTANAVADKKPVTLEEAKAARRKAAEAKRSN